MRLVPDHIQKIVRIGKNEEGRIFCKIKYTDGKLSISGVVGPMANGDCKGSCGQMYDTIINDIQTIKFAPKWDKVKAFEFVEYWKQWHLNDLQAGCKHQREAKWSDQLLDTTKEKTQDNMSIWTYKKDHPRGLLCEPCPTCGYKYGTKWLTMEVPDKVLKFLASLPATDVKPNWV